MNAPDKSSPVEQALNRATKLMTVLEIKAAAHVDEASVRSELKRLAQQGQIEHIPGCGRYDGRYGLLRPIAKVTVKDPLTAQEQASGDSEGGEADVRGSLVEAEWAEVKEVPSEWRAVGDRYGCNTPIELAAHISHLRGELDADRSLIVAIRDAMSDDMLSTADIPARIRELMETLESRHRAIDLHKEVSKANAQKINEQMADLANAAALNMKLEHLLAVERQANAALREQLDVHDEVAGRTVGYAVVAPKRPIRRFTAHDSAVKSAMAAASNGSGRGAVFALVPVGVAKRGAVWSAAK